MTEAHYRFWPRNWLYPRNCYELTCTRCRMFGPRKGGKFYFRNGLKSFVCAKCVARKQEQAA